MAYRVTLYGYRSWAREIFGQVLQHPDVREEYTCLHANVPGSPEGDYAALGVPLRVIDPRDKEGLARYFHDQLPDIALFYGWSWLVPGEITDHFRCVCLHPSLLPRYRGGSPLQNQIIAGEQEGGVTLFEMTQTPDAGDIIKQRPMSLGGDLSDIFRRIVDIGVDCTIAMLREYRSGVLQTAPQDHTKATNCVRRRRAQSRIEPEELDNDPVHLYDKIRALQEPYPNAYLELPEGTLFVTRSRVGEFCPTYHDITGKVRTGIGRVPGEESLYLQVGRGGIVITGYRFVPHGL